ncbi:hypothetical protein AGMMS49938_09910 [Fibrobacterales bacterium]|nr:hypothetical protein AGMMS49938_09910 [Fibrobacterales bacterium]
MNRIFASLLFIFIGVFAADIKTAVITTANTATTADTATSATVADIKTDTTANPAIIEQQFSFTIKTSNPDSTFAKIINTAESKGGYFNNYTANYLTLRIPVAALSDIQKSITESGKLEDKSFSSEDNSAEFEQLNFQIESRKKLLETYFDLVKNAPFAELQSVEREMTNLNAEIERLQGKKQAMEKRAALAIVAVYIYRQEVIVPPVKFEHSPFEWINKTDLNNLKGDF